MGEAKTSFLIKHMMNLGNLANWPNANVINTALVTEFIPEICKVPYDYLFRDDPVAMAECTLLVHEYLHLDLLIANLDTGRFPYLIKYCQAYKKYTGVDSFPTFSAPWTLAGNLYGLDNLVVEAYTNPEFVEEFLRRLVDDFQVPMLKDMNQAVPGMRELSLVDAFATIPMIDVSIIEKFIKPALERLMEQLDLPGMPLLDTAFFGSALLTEEDRRKFEDFVVWANGRFFCSDPDAAVLTPEYARKRANEYGLPLQTGVDAKLLQFGTVQEVIDTVKHYVLAGKNGPTPCIFFNNIAPNVPMENVWAAIHTLEIYGAPGAYENTPYTEPDFLPFEEFLKNKMQNNTEGYTFDWLKKSGYKDLLQ